MKLRHVAAIVISNVDKKSVEGESSVRLCNYTDVYNNPRIEPDQDFMLATASLEQIREFRLRAGDVLITKDSETPEDIGVPAYVTNDLDDVICGYHLAILRPKRGVVDGRYLYWAVAAEPTRRQFDAAAVGITRFGLRHEVIASVKIPLPEVSEQRAIADFLDTETARLDVLASKRQAMIELLHEKASQAMDVTLASHGFRFPRSLTPDWGKVKFPAGWRIATLGVVLRKLTNGYVGPTRDILRESGIPYVQSLHVKRGVIDFNRHRYYVDKAWHDERPRIHLQAGDVVIVQTGDIGQVAVVPKNFGEASCHALQIARTNPELLTGQFLAGYLRSAFGRHLLLSRASGALHPHLEGSIRDLPVVLPSLSVQAQIVDETAVYEQQFSQAVAVLERQLEVMRERRQALISAAVTGQIPIPGAA
jgi:type I restriction enzyme S subunit